MKRDDVLFSAVIAGVAIAVSLIMFFSSLYGEDEAITLRLAERVTQRLLDGNIYKVAVALGMDNHPPGRTLVLVPFMALFGPELWVIRLPNVLVWAAICVVAGAIAARAGGRDAAWVTGLGLAVTGAFQLQAMALGHGFLTLWGLLLVLHLQRSPPRALLDAGAWRGYWMATAIAAAGFLWFTSFLPVAGMLNLLYLAAALRIDQTRRRDALRAYVRASVPTGLFYLLYYTVFIGVPFLLMKLGVVDAPFGQFAQNLWRAKASHLNAASFVENVQVLNYYMFPFLYAGIAALGVVHLLVRNIALGALLLPYGLVTSFYLAGNTGQHFMSFAIWMLPFGVACCFRANPVRSGFAKIGAATLAAVVLAWTISLHSWPYRDADYPYWVSDATYGDLKWINNALMPVAQIKAKLAEVARDGPVTSFAGGAWQLFYMPELNWVETVVPLLGSDGCLKGYTDQAGNPVKVAIVFTVPSYCPDVRIRVHDFSGSLVHVVELI